MGVGAELPVGEVDIVPVADGVSVTLGVAEFVREVAWLMDVLCVRESAWEADPVTAWVRDGEAV